MFGSDYWGKKQPELMYSLAANRSTDPRSSISPSGSTMNEIDGDDIWLDKHVGTASMTPPTRQNCSRYSSQLWYKVFIGMTTFLDKKRVRMSIICSIRGSPTFSGFFLRFASGFTWSIFKYAWPLPLNSSSILNNQVWTYKLFAISFASEDRNSSWS